MDIKISRVYFAAALLLTAALALGGFLYFSKNLNLEAQPPNLEAELPKTPHLEARLLSEVKLLFVGDIMLDRWIRQVAEKKGYDFVFEEVNDLLKDKDLAIGNLEGPITDNKSISIASAFGARENYVFTFTLEAAVILGDYNIKLVNLGNNHILNFGEDGLEQTKKYLSEAGVGYFCANDLRFKIYDLGGRKVGFVCYNQFEKDAVERVIGDIRKIKGEREEKEKADIVILYAHWGKEYETKADALQKELARKFVDAGADLIIGSHPHVVQEKEIYNGKTIYYSLGNFIFDQYFNPNAAEGLAVEAIISPDRNMQFTEHYVQMKTNGQTVLIK